MGIFSANGGEGFDNANDGEDGTIYFYLLEIDGDG